MARICVVGTGYVGLVTGACLADLGNDVTCLDVDTAKIARLEAGEIPIFEPGLEHVVRRATLAGRLRFSTDYAAGCRDAEYVFIAVNTPSVAGGAGADMSYVERAARSIAEHLSRDAVIINKSTMPVGSGDFVTRVVRAHLRDASLSVAVVSNPEFLREGSAVRDFMQPDRIVLGAADRAAAERAASLYIPLRAPIVITDVYTSEMIKYASNAFLATKISFINEMARICDRLGADVREVAAGMGYDRRIGRAFLDAGPGFGGSCFPKDIRALTHMADNTGLHPQLLEAVMSINKDQRRVPVEKLERELGGAGSVAGKTVAVLGLAFKDNTDDMREAPAIDIVNALLQRGAAEVRAYDPAAQETARRLFPDWPVTYCADEYDCAAGADGLILVTEWQRFRNLDPRRLRAAMRPSPGSVGAAGEGSAGGGGGGPVFIDARNLFDPAEMRLFGFRYQGIGRGSTPPDYTAGELLAETLLGEPAGLDGHTPTRTEGRAVATEEK